MAHESTFEEVRAVLQTAIDHPTRENKAAANAAANLIDAMTLTDYERRLLLALVTDVECERRYAHKT